MLGEKLAELVSFIRKDKAEALSVHSAIESSFHVCYLNRKCLGFCMRSRCAYDERRYIVNGERHGEFKKHDYVTGKNEVGSQPDEVENDLAELIEEVNAIGAKAPLKAGAYLHARFENIHPFADGNGRVGRTLLNYWLMINDYPPTIVYEEDRRAYYDALQDYDEQEDLTPLVQFLEAQTVKTWSRSTEDKSPAPHKKLHSFLL